MSSDQHPQDVPGFQDEDLRRALRRLARVAEGEPPLNGSEVRALAGRRRRRWLVVPVLTVSGMAVSAAAFALTGGLSGGPGHTGSGHGDGPPVAASPSSAAPAGTGPSRLGPAPSAAGPGTTARPAGSPAAGASSRLPAPPASGPPAAACGAVPQGRTLVFLHALSIDGALAPRAGAVLSAVPVACAQGHLAPSGPLQRLNVAPDAAVTTTAPLSTGATRTTGTVEGLALALTRHPDQLFAIQRDASGLVVRMDEVYVP